MASEEKFKGYANPDILVSTEWLAEHLHDKGLRVLECDEDVLLYDQGHIPGAIKLDWQTELNDPLRRDYLDQTHFEA
ncbi:MAG TPA: rhodanese-like domain-containing protein, partial [Chloroflexia bacterium]|nr:rhodanese-like domain-containing protein [Chloroflexia bacterium]